MRGVLLKITAYIPIVAAFIVILLFMNWDKLWEIGFTLGNGLMLNAWGWIFDNTFLFYLSILSIWHIGSWILVKTRLLKTENAIIFCRRLLLAQVGLLPAFFGSYITHWWLRSFTWRSFGMRASRFVWMETASPSFTNAVNRAFVGMTLVILAVWFICSFVYSKKGMTKIELMLLLNAAAVLALIRLLNQYILIVRDYIIYNNLEVALSVTNRGISIAQTEEYRQGVASIVVHDNWVFVDPMHFYMHTTRIIIRMMPWLPSDNILLPIFIGFGLLLAASFTGATLGRYLRLKKIRKKEELEKLLEMIRADKENDSMR